MRVMVCGSLSNAPVMEETRWLLALNGHEAVATRDLDLFVADPKLGDDLDKDYHYCLDNNILRQ